MHIAIVLFCFVVVHCLQADALTSISCNDYKMKNGRARMKTRGKLVRFQCNKGYILFGERYNYCLKGLFEAEPPKCVKPTCTKINKTFPNAVVIQSYSNAVLQLYCKPGYVAQGPNVSYCDGTKWSNNLATCLPSNVETPMSCDFEDENLCGWSHDFNHDFDWRRQNFQTPSGHIGTGPKFDHTSGKNGSGFYVYIESTSRLENDTARLISPFYKKMESGMCFTFYYHMFGTGIGHLKVYIKKVKDNFKTLKPLFVESGNQGDVWKKGEISLDEGVDQDFQIILEGIRGKSYVSDIAVDDVSLSTSCWDEDNFSSFATEVSVDYELTTDYGSCQNRCGSYNSIDMNSNETQPLLCECIDSCLYKDTCCPDYKPVCLDNLEDFDYTTSEIESTTMETEPDTEQPSTTFKPLLTTTYTNKRLPTLQPTVTDIQTTTEKIITTSKIVPSIIPRNNNKTELVTLNTPEETTKYPEIISTTFKIQTKDVSLSPVKPNKNKNVKIATKKTPEIKTVSTTEKTKPITLATTTTETTENLPKTTEIYIPPPPVITDYDDENNKTIEETLSSLEPQVQKLLTNNKSTTISGSQSNLILVGIGTLAVVLCALLVAIFVAKKYSHGCRNIRLNSRNHDSMSDVRFLATDEVLDFTWRTSDN